jgi:gliding motility-associated-like protein
VNQDDATFYKNKESLQLSWPGTPFYMFTGMLQTNRIILILILVVISVEQASGQTCTTLGQNPFSAFPVCGSTSFEQKSVPPCGGRKILTSCNDGIPYTDINPYWYKFTCYTSGTLGLLITPKVFNDDYDWQLFDITGRDPMDIYTDPTMIVCYNWSSEPGATGTSTKATGLKHCGNVTPIFSAMPMIEKGHEYLLMISHFDGDSQSGYSLSFPTSGDHGGTASIVNPVVPTIIGTSGVCDGTQILVRLNTRINCTTIAANGSDFTVNSGRNVVGATGKGCSTGFDSDSILITLDVPLTLGNYTVSAKTGTDGNTVLDNCSAQLPPGTNSSLRFLPKQPTPMDSISTIKCITDSLQLVFSKPINCGSIAADGSDFVITGPVPVTVQSAKGVCVDGVSSYIHLKLGSPIRTNGTFTITLKNGSDGNTLIDECAEQTPAGSTLFFTTRDITSADFQPQVTPGCRFDTLYLSHNGNGNANSWKWMIDASTVSTSQQHTIISRAFGNYTAQLSVTNGICSDAISRTFTLPDFTVKAAFSVADTLCPTDALEFTDQSSSGATSWRWNFGNGTTGTSKIAIPQRYPLTGRVSQYTVSLEVSNSLNCTDITHKMITVLASCYMAVPSAFTPNGDGLNDYFHPLNAFKADDMVFRVFNRFGQVVFESKEWTKKWDGRFKGLPQPVGTYVWTFTYTDRGSGEKMSLKGTTVLIR